MLINFLLQCRYLLCYLCSKKSCVIVYNSLLLVIIKVSKNGYVKNVKNVIN